VAEGLGDLDVDRGVVLSERQRADRTAARRKPDRDCGPQDLHLADVLLSAGGVAVERHSERGTCELGSDQARIGRVRGSPVAIHERRANKAADDDVLEEIIELRAAAAVYAPGEVGGAEVPA